MVFAFLIILGCYLLLVARLVYLQLKQGPFLLLQAVRLREQKIVLHARRGALLDRSGVSLAVSLYSGVVGFDPTVMHPADPDPKKLAHLQSDLNKSVDRAAAILSIPAAELHAKVDDACAHFSPAKPVRFVTICKDVSIEVANAIREAKPRLVGFGVEDSSKRHYADGSNAAQVVGYTSAEGVGVAGLERSCGPYMRGKDGYAVAEVDTARREIPDTQRKLIPVADGLDVHTTLDGTAQRIAMEEGQKIADKYHPKGISIVIVEPTTGNVLALVSIPTFDPNPGERGHLDPEALADRCCARLYEPGSTLKSLTIAAALDEGTITTANTFYCPGAITVGNKTIHCAMHGQAGGHGLLDARGCLQHSCNVIAAQIGMKIGPEKLFEWEHKFGLLDKIEVGLPGEQRGRLSFDRHEHIYTDAKAARVAFGHSITTTPLHVAMAYASLVNGGVLMRPRLVTGVSDTNGKMLRSWAPKPVRRVISEATSNTLCDMLRNVVTTGTGRAAAIPGFMVGGKTGTANKYRAGAYVGSFIGYLPASAAVKPKVVILVAVDEPHGAYYGAEVAAPAFQAIAQRLMEFWQVPKDDPQEIQAHEARTSLRKSGEPVPALLMAMGKD
jgi:stage V sporulation protein D (sporulation-specific penicillin-binding protein)